MTSTIAANKSLLFQSILAIGARFTGVGLNLFLQVLAARILTLGHNGDLRMLITLVIGVALFSRIGVEQLLVKEVASIEDGQETFGTQFLKRSYAVVFITSLVFIFLWIGLSPLLNSAFFGEVSLTNLILASIGIYFFNLVTINSFYFKALHMPSASALVQNALPASCFLLFIVLFWDDFAFNQFYLMLYTASTVMAGIISILVILPWTQGMVLTQVVANAELSKVPTLHQLAKRALPLAPVSIFSFLMLWSDTLMVGAFLGSEEVALYTTAAAISFLSLFFLGALDATIYPRLLSISKNKPELFIAFFWKATAFVVVGLLLVTVVMGLLAKPALWLFGAQYLQALNALLILLLAQWFRAISLTFSFLFIIKEQVRYLNITLVGALVINLLANTMLISTHGMVGAAVATLIANGFLAGIIVLFFYSKKLLSGYT